MLNEYACAIEGIVQFELVGIGNVRVPPPIMAGPPKVPLALRVSTTRHCVIPTNTTAFAGTVASITRLEEVSDCAAVTTSVLVDCQYKGASQDFSGTASLED